MVAFVLDDGERGLVMLVEVEEEAGGLVDFARCRSSATDGIEASESSEATELLRSR